MSPLLLRVARPNVFSSSKSFCVIRIKKDTKEAMASTSRPESKVILCGEYGVGKSSIFRRFANDSFVDLTNKSTAECRQSTLGLDCISRTFDVPGFRPVRVQLWDTGGLERVASVTTSYYKFAEAAILVFSLNSLDSFHALTQHLLEVLNLAENARLFLVGNKCDLTPHEVQDSDIGSFMEQFPKMSGVFKVSCRQNIGLSELFDKLAECLASSSVRQRNMNVLRLHSTRSNAINADGSSSNAATDSDQSIELSCCAK